MRSRTAKTSKTPALLFLAFMLCMLHSGCGGGGAVGTVAELPPGITTGRITGRVTELVPMQTGAGRVAARTAAAQSDSLEGLTVTIPGTSFSTTTDASGFFSIAYLPKGKNTMIVITDPSGSRVAKTLVHVDTRQTKDVTVDMSSTFMTLFAEKLAQDLKTTLAAYSNSTTAEILADLEDYILAQMLLAADIDGDGAITIADFDANGDGIIALTEIASAADASTYYAQAELQQTYKKDIQASLEDLQTALAAENLAAASSLFSSRFAYTLNGGTTQSYADYAASWQTVFNNSQIASALINSGVKANINPDLTTQTVHTIVTATDSAGATVVNRLATFAMSLVNGVWVITGLKETDISSALVSLAISPASATVAAGATVQFSAKGLFADGSTMDMTSHVDWLSSIPITAAFRNPAVPGLLTGLNTTPYSVTAVSASLAGIDSAAAAVTVSGGAGTASVLGMVTDKNTGVPISGAAVKIYADSYMDIALTDDYGQYAFYGVPAGTYYIIATKGGYTLETKTVVVR